jgi:NitT/TauT family transport system ATP-binding protein
VFITHSIQEALLLSDRVVVMGAAPGRITNIVDVPFARPRNITKLKTESSFRDLEYQIWQQIRANSALGQSEEGS